MGISTTNVTMGKVTTEEIRDVKEESTTIYQPLKESRVNEKRVLGKTRVSEVQDRPIRREVSKSPAPVRTQGYTETKVTTTTQ